MAHALRRARQMLEHLVPLPRKVEIDVVDLAAPPAAVWDYVRHENLADSPLVRALFALRTLPSRLSGGPAEPLRLCIDDIRSTPEAPGFQVLGDESGHELTVGAIGKVWQLDIPFVHVDGPEGYMGFTEPGWIKVAWAIRVEPRSEAGTHLVIEVRVDATDEASWAKFVRYWEIIGPGSHFIRHSLIAGLRRRFGTPDARPSARGRRQGLAGRRSASRRPRRDDPRNHDARDARNDLAVARPDGRAPWRILRHRRPRQRWRS